MSAPGEHFRPYRRFLEGSERCPKCGTYPQPKWIEKGGFYGGGMNGLQAEEEMLWFECPCGYCWKTPPRDAGSRQVRGIMVPEGYDVIVDDRAPACPAGRRIVRIGGRP